MEDKVVTNRIPFTALFRECEKQRWPANDNNCNHEQYSSSTETKEEYTSEECIDFNYAEVASDDDEKGEFMEKRNSTIQQSERLERAYNPNSVYADIEESNVVKSVVYFNSLKNPSISRNNNSLRTLSNELICQIDAYYNIQLQRYISESGNTAMYKYMQGTANSNFGSESLPNHKFTLPEYIKPELHLTDIRIDESLGKLAVTPIFHKYQLLGDSQLLRFSETILGLRRWRSKGSRARIGYCVSGQSVAELGARIRAAECCLKSAVIVLIGTNDMRKNSDVLPILEAYSDMVTQLERHCEKIVLLTIPPLPFIHDKDPQMHIVRLKIVNTFIKELANDDNIFVLDLCSLFISFDNTISTEYFEKFIRDDKLDLIHLNKYGLKMLRTLLDTQYFDKYKI